MTPADLPGKEPPLRVLQLLTYYLPHRTGLTLHVQRLAEELAARGHQVTVLSARFRDDLPREEEVQGVRVVRLHAPLRVSRGVLMPGYPAALWRLAAEHDVVHAHTPLLEVPLAALITRARRRSLVITHHGDLVLPAGFFNRVVQRLVRTLFRPAAGIAHTLTGYSADYALHSSYLAPFAAKVVPIPPPVVVPPPDPLLVSGLRMRFGLEGRRVVGYAGRFVQEKRPDLLLRALPRLAQAFPDIVVAFAGPQRLPYERFEERCRPLIEAAGERVRFLGLLEDPRELAAFYRLCEVLVLPSETECFGLVQVEAMLCGTPVVATDIPGARVPVTVTGMGLLVPPRDPDALEHGISEVLQRRAAFVRPRATVATAFSLADTVDRYEAVLRAAVARQ
jgi:glycosyltransferase involved in cell wall biosynthesis